MKKNHKLQKGAGLGHIYFESEIALPFIDRIRLICGSRLTVQTFVDTQWRTGDFAPEQRLLIEEAFDRYKRSVKRFFKARPKPVDINATN